MSPGSLRAACADGWSRCAERRVGIMMQREKKVLGTCMARLGDDTIYFFNIVL